MSEASSTSVKGPLTNKVALVTGASAGFGRETALMLAQAGAKVIAVARRLEKLNELAKESPLISPLVMDVRASTSEWQSALKNQRIDILVNNAGLARGRETFENTKDEETEEIFETNVMGLIRLTKVVVPQMLEREDGDIVNIGSIAGLFTYASGSIYCASKFAVHALSQAWRADFLGKNIRVMEICPGMAETEFSEVRFRDKDKAKQVYAGLKALSAKDVAEAIVWSLSRPSHVTIQNMVIMPTDQAGVGQVHRR